MKTSPSLIFPFAALISLAAVPASSAAAPAQKPNVLFIVVDDLRPELGCYGKDYMHTPNIDALAARGMVFDRAYCQQAVCSPSRTAVMTGARPDTTKVWDLKTHFRKALPKVVTLQQQFMQNGYFVQGMGKVFHLPDPPSWSVPWQNPKKIYALPESVKMKGTVPSDDDAPAEDDGGKTTKGKAKANSERRVRGPAFECADVPDNAYTDGMIADLAISTLRDISKKREPFFLAVGINKPHLPFSAPKKYWDLYDPAKIELAPNKFRAKGSPDYAVLTSGELLNYAGIPNGSIPDDIARQLKHAYYAATSYADAQIGKVLDELNRLGLRDNTIVILWGDHGWKLGEHDSWCKHTDTENDANAPLILSVPGMKTTGQHTKALVEFVDIYPTLCELAGLPLPSHLEGTSVTPLLKDPQRPWKTAAFSQYPRSQKGGLMGYSMRTDRYRFTIWVNDKDIAKVDAIELYDHENDPQENVNIADNPENAALVKKLTTQWKAGWQAAKPPGTS